jgi:hypothetical protein
MMFKETVAVYSGNYKESNNTLCGQNEELLNVKEIGTYRHHWAWNG